MASPAPAGKPQATATPRKERSKPSGGNAPVAAATSVTFVVCPDVCGSRACGSHVGPVRWLVVTGSLADLVGLSDVAREDLEDIEEAARPTYLNIGIGLVWTDVALPLHAPALLEVVGAYVLENTPPVCSVGTVA